jgi:hypothetical protein
VIPSRRAGPVPGRGTRGRARAPLRGSRTGWTAARGSPKPCRTPQGIPEAGDLIEIGPCLIGEVPLADLLRRRRRLPGDSHRPVVLLHIEPERLRVSRPRPPARADRHDASASQDRGRLSVARAGVDPVQRVEHRHRANRDGAGVPPVLERGRDDADEREPGGPGPRPVRQGRASPRSASGTVACPVPQPISTTRSPCLRPAAWSRSSNKAPGNTGRVRS